MEKKKNILTDVLMNIPDTLESDDISLLNKEKENNLIRKVDYDERKSHFYIKAKKTIDSLLKFYFNESLISEDDYIEQRAIQENISLAQLMIQIENVSDAISTMMKVIDSGNVKPSYFQVLSEVERTFIDLLKLKSMHLIQVEDSMKRLLNDKNIYSNTSSSKGNSDNKNAGLTTRGTKNLMKQLKELIVEEEIDEADIEN